MADWWRWWFAHPDHSGPFWLGTWRCFLYYLRVMIFPLLPVSAVAAFIKVFWWDAP